MSFVGGLHLFGGWAGPWVSAHFDLEQWAQSWREKKKERETEKAIPELVEVRPEKMMQEAGAGENPSTGKQMSPVARQSEEELE